jgi:hypothetical protein
MRNKFYANICAPIGIADRLYETMKTEVIQLERAATKEDVMRFYQLKSVRTIEHWMKAGLIPYQKIGKLVRFSIPEVQAAIAKRCGKNQRTR